MKTIVKKKAITILLATAMTAASIMPAAPVMAKKKYTKAKTTVTVQKKAKTFKKTISLTEKLTIKVKYKKKKIKAAKVTFKSSKKKVATVSEKGVVTPKKVGKTTISIKYGKKKAKLKLMVVKGVSSVKINKDLVDLKLGESRTLSAKVSPANATIKTVKWYSSNPSVVSVTNDGVITGLKDGLAVITAVSDQGNKKDTCNITVSSSYTTGSSYAEPIGGKNKSGNPGTGNSGSTTKPSSGSGSSTGNAGGQSSGGNSSHSGSGQGDSGTGSNTGNSGSNGSGSGNSGTSNTGSNNNITFVPGDDSTYDALVAPNWIGDPNDPMATLTYRQLALSGSPYGYDINEMTPGWHKITLPVLFVGSLETGSEKYWKSNVAGASSIQFYKDVQYMDQKNGQLKKSDFAVYYTKATEEMCAGGGAEASRGSLIDYDEMATEVVGKYPQLKGIFYDGTANYIEQLISGPLGTYKYTYYGIGEDQLEKMREYSTATAYVNNEIATEQFNEWAENLNKKYNTNVWTTNLIKMVIKDWAAKVDDWKRGTISMKWQYFVYGDGENNPMGFNYWMLTSEANQSTKGPGVCHLGSYAAFYPIIVNEIECWIYVPTKK